MTTQFITTPSFTLSAYIDGNLDAPYLLLCLPGFLDSGNYVHIQSHRAYFADRGYLCVSFDPPGTFASPGTYTVTNYLHAVEELIAYFGNKPTVILGHSLGGSIALLASFSNQHVTKTISIMSSCDIKGRYQKYFGKSRQTTGVRTGVRDMPDPELPQFEYTVPWSFVEDAIQYDILDQLVTSSKPKLFIVGKEDSILDPALAKKGYTLAKEPKKLVEVDCYDHNYRLYPEIIQQINHLVEEFIR